MQTVVTGGAGFIGGHLVGHLLERGDYVTNTAFPALAPVMSRSRSRRVLRW